MRPCSISTHIDTLNSAREGLTCAMEGGRECWPFELAVFKLGSEKAPEYGSHACRLILGRRCRSSSSASSDDVGRKGRSNAKRVADHQDVATLVLISLRCALDEGTECLGERGAQAAIIIHGRAQRDFDTIDELITALFLASYQIREVQTYARRLRH